LVLPDLVDMQSDAAEAQTKAGTHCRGDPAAAHRGGRTYPASFRRSPHQSGHRGLQGVPDAAAARHRRLGVSDAARQLVHGFRASLEHSRDHILFVLDAKDAFQTVKRSVVLERMSKITGLEAQTTFWHARHNAQPMRFVGPLRNRLFGDDDTRGDSEEGSSKAHPTRPLCIAQPHRTSSSPSTMRWQRKGAPRACTWMMWRLWRHRKPDSWRSRSTSRKSAGARPACAARRSRYTRLGSTLELSRQAPIASRQRERAVYQV